MPRPRDVAYPSPTAVLLSLRPCKSRRAANARCSELSVPREESIARLSLRAKEQGRTDDTEEVIANRLAIYERETAPIMGVYHARGIVDEVDGVGTLDEVTERVIASLEQRGLIRPAAA